MNSTFNPASGYIPKVFLDTTVLCGALRKPDGISRQILRLARAPIFFTPVISKVCLFEFYRNAFEGLGSGSNKVYYSPGEVLTFLKHFIDPILDENPAVNSLVGRYSIETVIREYQQIGKVLSDLSGCSDEEAYIICKQQEMHEPLKNFDKNDFHVWVTAIQQNCDMIVTSNTKRFPIRIGKIERVRPTELFDMFMD